MEQETARLPVIADVPESDLGPAMIACTKGQRRFVIALIETGGTNETAAARNAGYGNTTESTKVAAHRLSHNPKVIAAIREEGERRLKFGGLLATEVLIAHARGEYKDAQGVIWKIEPKLQQKAAVEIANRAGLIARTEHKVVIEDNRTDNEMIDRIAEIARKHNLDPAKLLGDLREKAKSANVIDAEFTEVEDDPFAYIPGRD